MVSHSEPPLHISLLYGAFQKWLFTCVSTWKITAVKTYMGGRKQQPLLFHLPSIRRRRTEQKVIAKLVTPIIWVCTRENMHLFSFAASKLLAFPLNVYHLQICRWKRNPVNAASTIPVRVLSGPYRKTMICSFLRSWICWGKRIAVFTVNIASMSLVGSRAILKHKWPTETGKQL